MSGISLQLSNNDNLCRHFVYRCFFWGKSSLKDGRILQVCNTHKVVSRRSHGDRIFKSYPAVYLFSVLRLSKSEEYIYILRCFFFVRQIYFLTNFDDESLTRVAIVSIELSEAIDRFTFHTTPFLRKHYQTEI